MSHYEERLAQDLQTIRLEISHVASDVSQALQRSVAAIATHERNLLYDVIIDDLAVNRRVRKIDALCHAFVARHLPAAGHLRFISSVLRLTIALERAGDYAVTISRVTLQLSQGLNPQIVEKIESLARKSQSMMEDAIRAFLDGNVELARSTKRLGRRIDTSYDNLFHELIEETPRRPRIELASLLTIFGKIERFSDQAKNICEEAVFATTGDLKAPKIFRMLFLDEHNDLVSQIAAGIAWKSFPERGIFFSAGWSPHEALHPQLNAVADRFALDMRRARPTLVTDLDETPTEYHVVVALNSDANTDVPHIPYHTILQRWDVPAPTVEPGEEFDRQIDISVRDLTDRINSLMERLSGRNTH